MSNSRESKGDGSVRTFDLYIGHVPKSIPEAALAEIFSKYGTIFDILIRHSTGNYGYAIVKFKYKKDADKVLRQINRIHVGNHEMEVKNGKRSSQSAENCNGTSSMPKAVSFAEPLPNIHHLGNIHMAETPMPVKDFLYPIYPACESVPIYPPCESVNPVYPACENAPVPVAIEIMCTHVEDPITFYGCCVTIFQELQHISMKLNSICPNLPGLVRKPILNNVYGALYNADCKWYRCRVLQYGSLGNSSTCMVEYIDYGNVAEVCYTDMVELSEPLKNLRPFATKYVFSNLIPTPKSLNCDGNNGIRQNISERPLAEYKKKFQDGESQNLRKVSYLHHLVNHRMSLCALHKWGSSEYLVTKCSCNGIDVIAELVRNGHAMYRKQESSKSVSPKMDKSSKVQESKKSKKKSDKSKKGANSTSKNSCDMKNGSITILEKSDRSSSSVESHDFMPKKIIKRGSDTIVNNNQVSEDKAVNHVLKVDAVISNVKVINNIRSLIPLDSYDDLIGEAVDLLKSETNITLSSDLKQLVEDARKAYCEALKEIKDCSDQDLLVKLKEKRNQCRVKLCNELEQFFKSFDDTLLEKRKQIQKTITALESNSTAWLNVYLPKLPETIDDLLIAFNKEKERKRKNIEMARKNTDEKHENFFKVYTDLGKEFSLNVVSCATNDTCLVNNVGKKGSWALKFDEALTEFSIALENERKISTVIEDRSYISVIHYILEKLDIPKDKIDAECDVYEEYKLLYDDLMNNLDLNPIFDELHAVRKTIDSFNSLICANTDELCDEHLKLHSAFLREDALLASVVKASAQHFPELIREHPELRLDEYQKHFCLLKFSWNAHFFPTLEKCSRIEPSYISSLGDESVVIKKFELDSESEKVFIRKVKKWNEIKSTAVVKIRGLFKDKQDSSTFHETSCSIDNKSLNGDIYEVRERKQEETIDNNHNTVTNINDEMVFANETNCQWIDCNTELMARDKLITHVYEKHIENNNKSFVCRWKACSQEEKSFKSQDLFIVHLKSHIGGIHNSCTIQNVIYAVLPLPWSTLYDNPLPVPVDYKTALNILQQILEGLCDIHSRGITHGAIHPMSVLHNCGKILLDFNFDKQLLKDKLCLNGINFQVPKEDYKSADMYGYGCLVLWVLFPNLSFQSTENGIPNISAFQSIIENMLIPKDFSSLSALLNVNCNIRPSSRMLRSNGFLKDLSIITESSYLDLA